MVPKQQKVEKFYFSIGEVAQLFGLNESTLRFWEKEFDEISPRKTKKGTRYYRQEDIEQIRLIYHLVKERGMTIFSPCCEKLLPTPKNGYVYG